MGTHSVLRCRVCRGYLGTLPGRWAVLRALWKGDAPDGRGALRCPSCARKWEVAPVQKAA